MSRDKQIEEMAEAICGLNTSDGCLCDGGYCNHNCLAYEKAEHLYNAGYRKASDLAEEIFAEIEELMSKLDRRYMASGNPKQSWGVRGAISEIAELKKKYTESEKDNGKV